MRFTHTTPFYSVLSTLGLFAVSPAYSSIVRNDVDYQYFRDFAENKGAFSIGASNISIQDKQGKILGRVLSGIPMPDFRVSNRHRHPGSPPIRQQRQTQLRLRFHTIRQRHPKSRRTSLYLPPRITKPAPWLRLPPSPPQQTGYRNLTCRTQQRTLAWKRPTKDQCLP